MTLHRCSGMTWIRRASNPGAMTLEGTNSYVLGREPLQQTIVVDPGPADSHHLASLAAAGAVQLILLTHRHLDHSAGARQLHEATGAPVRAAQAAQCVAAEPLSHGEWIAIGGVRLQVLLTPGHTSDSACFYLPDDVPLPHADGAVGSMLTGDTILGRGTSVIDFPDGRLGAYLESVEYLRGFGAITALPGHGPVITDLATVCVQYIDHRRLRLDQVSAAMTALGSEASVEAMTAAVYPGITESLRPAAVRSLSASIDYLGTARA